MSTHETYPQAGLRVARTVFHGDIAEQLEQDCAAYMELPETPSNRIRRELPDKQGNQISYRRFTVEQLIGFGRPATTRLLTRLHKTKGYRVSVNHQPPFTFQPFHRDPNVAPPLWVVHLSDGIFDVAPTARNSQEASDTYQQLPVYAGDVVAQYVPEYFHAGGNPTEHDRYNMVIYRLGGDAVH